MEELNWENSESCARVDWMDWDWDLGWWRLHTVLVLVWCNRPSRRSLTSISFCLALLTDITYGWVGGSQIPISFDLLFHCFFLQLFYISISNSLLLMIIHACIITIESNSLLLMTMHHHYRFQRITLFVGLIYTTTYIQLILLWLHLNYHMHHACTFMRIWYYKIKQIHIKTILLF